MRSYWITSVEELGDLENEWEALREECGGSIFMSFCLGKLWCEVHKGVNPRILVVRDGRDPVGLAPMVSYKSRAEIIPLRALTFVGGRSGKLRYHHVGVLADPGRPDVPERIASEVQKADWDILRMRYMSDSDVTKMLASLMCNDGTCWEYPPTPNIICSIPETGNVICNFGSRTRKNVRQKMRRLEKDTAVQFRAVSADGVERAVDLYAQQHIKRWRRKGGSLFGDPENVLFLRKMVSISIAEGFGYMNELLIDGRVAAQEFGLIDHDIARLYRGGMDDDFAQYSPGILLMCYLMEYLREKGIHEIDMGRGREEYKIHLGGQVRHLPGLYGRRGLASLLFRLDNTAPVKKLAAVCGRLRIERTKPAQGINRSDNG